MPGPRPELIFVSGPQRGQRAVLMRDVTLGGRSDLADIVFTEEFVSREQLQFQRIPEGWIVESVARSNPMYVNGKRYKPGKQILLASGDVITVGAETEILFVEAMDDPNHVLADYRREHPETEPVPAEPVAPAEEAPEPTPASSDVAPSPPIAKPPRPKTTKKKNPSRTKKYFIAFLIYLAVLAVGVIVLSKAKNAKETTEEGPPPHLPSHTVSDVLQSDLQRRPNEVSAQRSLREARMYFRHRTSERQNLYQCIKAYRLYKAYRRPEQRTFLPEDERKYNQAVEELTTKVRTIYDRAWVAEMNAQWAKARQQYESILKYIPLSLADDDPDVQNVLLDNVMSSIHYVSKQRGEK